MGGVAAAGAHAAAARPLGSQRPRSSAAHCSALCHCRQSAHWRGRRTGVGRRRAGSGTSGGHGERRCSLPPHSPLRTRATPAPPGRPPARPSHPPAQLSPQPAHHSHAAPRRPAPGGAGAGGRSTPAQGRAGACPRCHGPRPHQNPVRVHQGEGMGLGWWWHGRNAGRSGLGRAVGPGRRLTAALVARRPRHRRPSPARSPPHLSIPSPPSHPPRSCPRASTCCAASPTSRPRQRRAWCCRPPPTAPPPAVRRRVAACSWWRAGGWGVVGTGGTGAVPAVHMPTGTTPARPSTPSSGDVVAVGDGRLPDDKTHEFELKPGDTVVYSKFGLGCTDMEVGGVPHILLRESDVIGTMPRSGAVAADVPELKPLGDRVLLRVQESASVTAGGVVLPETARERPIAGVVVRTGPGKVDDETNERKPCKAWEEREGAWVEGGSRCAGRTRAQHPPPPPSRHPRPPALPRHLHTPLSPPPPHTHTHTWPPSGQGGRHRAVLQVGGRRNGDACRGKVRGAAGRRRAVQDVTGGGRGGGRPVGRGRGL